MRHRLLAVLFVAAAAVVGAGCAKPKPSRTHPVELTYYYLKFCTFCQGVKTTVEAMPAQFPEGVLKVRTVEHLEPEAVAAVKALGFKSHGLVMRIDDEIVYQQRDHRVDVGQVQLALNRLIGPPTPLQPLADARPSADAR